MTPAQSRLRLKTIEYLLAAISSGKGDKLSPRELLKQGYIHSSLEAEVKRFKEELWEKYKTQGQPLSFRELSTWNTWFAMHPEKVAGKEVVTTSFHFPLQIKATKEDIIRMIRSGMAETQDIASPQSPQSQPVKPQYFAVHQQYSSKTTLKMKLKAKAIKAKLKLSRQMNGLGALSGTTKAMIHDNRIAVQSVINKSLQGLSGPGQDLLSFDDIITNYNKGISEEEIQAWVWYKRKQGEPMKGWENYFIKEGLNGLGLISPKSRLGKMVSNEVLFYHDGELLPYPIYAYGNMYDRELQLSKDRDAIIQTFGQQTYDKHAKVIAEAKPKTISVMNPDARERPKILLISSFARKFTVSNLREDTGVELAEEMNLPDAFAYWLKDGVRDSELLHVSKYELWYYYYKAQNVPRNYSKDQKDNIAKYAPLEGEQLFARFLNEALTTDTQQKLDISWNRLYNGWSSVPYHRIPIGFECSAKFKQFDFQFTPIQREGIAFMKAVGSGVIAYDVGVGKTVTAIITLANEIYSGKCKRPVIVVPNPTYRKWIKEIFGYEDEETGEFVAGVLSHTGVKLNDWYNLGTKILKGIDLTKPVPEKSITMLTYEGFTRLGYSEKLMNDLFGELSKVLAQTDDNDKSRRDLEKKYQKFRELIGTGNKGTVVDVDGMLFDYLIIDEAHNFRNVFSYVPQDEEGNKRFNIQSGESARAQKAFFICNYIQRTYGSNVMLLTATPFTNNPVEIFSMTSLVGYNTMRHMGIDNLYTFMELFILQSLEYVNSYDGSIKQAHVVKAFNNRLILQKLIFNHINYKTGEEAGVKRPCKINLPKTTFTDQETGLVRKLPADQQITTYLEMNEAQEENQAAINALAKSHGSSVSERMGNIMRALSGSLDNALSPYIYDKTFPETAQEFVNGSPKIKYVCECIRSVKKHHKAKGAPVSGQVIYANRGKDWFKYIKQYLEEDLGYKTGIKYNKGKVDEVEIIVSGISQEMKEKIKDAFLDGVCKVIIGTATIREGIDLQKYGTVLYNMYPDWNPTDVKQLEGRIWRQGNSFGYIRSVMPLVQNSMDVFVFQKLEEKTSRLNDIWYRADRGNVLDVEALDPEEVKFALFTDLMELAKIVIDKEEKEINRNINILEEDLSAIKKINYAIHNRKIYREKCTTYLQEWKEGLKEFPTQIERYAQRWQVSPAQMNEYEDRSKELVKTIEQFQEAANQDDKEMLAIARSVRGSTFANRFVVQPHSYDWDMYKQYILEVAKSERTVLQQKGYTIDTDFEEIKAGIQKEIDAKIAQLAGIKDPKNYERIMQEIARKKEENKVEGRIPELAMEDFANLNYLLDYKFADIEPDVCELPQPGETQNIATQQAKTQDIASRKVKPQNVVALQLKIRAKAIKIKLKLAA